MPYCPKCDMEFVEGVTVCTDCGGPLLESREAAEALKKAEKEKQEEEMRRRYEEMMAAEETDGEETEEGETDKKQKDAPYRPTVYVKKGQRYEDMTSSASAFFLVGGILAVGAVVLWTGIVKLPMAGFSKYMFQGIVTVMAAGCFGIAISSKKSAAVLKAQAADEEKETEEIVNWFLKTYSGRGLDEQIRSEEPDLTGEEMSLKRFELIQDYLVTGRDLPDQAYVDALCDIIYGKLYEGEEANG